MFSKTIFKQTLKQNWKLWAVFTALTAAMGAVIIAVFDPRMMQNMLDMFMDIPGIGDRISERIGGELSLLGMLGNSFYGMQGVILPLVFVIMTANSLIASQVDRGSMAYTLSTPIKRVKVVSTQALYMITSVFCMFLAVTVVGLGTVQIAHKGLWGMEYTSDVKAVAETMNLDSADVADDLTIISTNPAAISAGAEARGIEEDVYVAYLNMKLNEKAYAAATDVLNVDMQTVSRDLTLIRNNEDALKAAADAMGMEPMMYAGMLDQMIAQSGTSEQSTEMQDKVFKGLEAAAVELDMDVYDLAADMDKMKDNSHAMSAAVSASGLPEEMFIGMINQQLADKEMKYDLGIDFNVKDYINLNLGIFLLMFAVAGVSFLFSCVFNLTKNSLTFGAGIPIACLLFQIMSQASGELEKLKYLSLNTLFDPSAITGGGTFLPQFIVLAVLGAALYLIGIKVFKEKDLPL